MEHATTIQLDSGLLRITPDEGYSLYNLYSGKYHSEVEAHSEAGWKAVLTGTPPQPHTRTLEEAKAEKIAELANYDASPNVNAFYLSGNPMWIAPEERANYMLTIESAKRNGINTVSFLGVAIPVDNAIAMLDAVNLYAMQCVAVTEAHRNAINALATIEAVDNYDYSGGYPAKPSF